MKVGRGKEDVGALKFALEVKGSTSGPQKMKIIACARPSRPIPFGGTQRHCRHVDGACPAADIFALQQQFLDVLKPGVDHQLLDGWLGRGRQKKKKTHIFEHIQVSSHLLRLCALLAVRTTCTI